MDYGACTCGKRGSNALDLSLVKMKWVVTRTDASHRDPTAMLRKQRCLMSFGAIQSSII
jgi:hypothetical protein